MFDSNRRKKLCARVKDVIKRGAPPLPSKYRDKLLNGLVEGEIADFNVEDFPEFSGKAEQVNLTGTITEFLKLMVTHEYNGAYSALKVLDDILEKREKGAD